MAKSTVKKKTTTGKQQVTWAAGMPFGKLNYILMLSGMVVIAVGFILLSGGGSDDPAVFSEAIFDTRRLTIAPITLVVGFIIEFAAILIKVKPAQSQSGDSQSLIKKN
jgi:hypothetical protein